jgi:hypothetical protein
MAEGPSQPQLMTQAWDHYARMLSAVVKGVGGQSSSDQLQRAADDVQSLAEALALGDSLPVGTVELLQQAFRWLDEGAEEPPALGTDGLLPCPSFPHVDIYKLQEHAASCVTFPIGRVGFIGSENGGDELALRQIVQVAMEEKRPVLAFTQTLAGKRPWVGLAYSGLRLCCATSQIPFWQFKSCMLDNYEWGRLSVAMQEWSQCSLFVEQADILTVPEIVFKSRRASRMAGGELGLIVIEQSQRISGLQANYFRMPEWMGMLKSLARELNVTVLMTHSVLTANDFDVVAQEADSALRL